MIPAIRSLALALVLAATNRTTPAQPASDPDGHVVSLPEFDSIPPRLFAPGAAGIQAFIEELRLPPGARLLLRSATADGQPGPIAAIYAGTGPLHGDPFWSDSVPGDTLFMECENAGPAPFRVTQLRHLTPQGLEKLVPSAPSPSSQPGGEALFRGHFVTYQVRDGMAIYDGDILLGPAADIHSVLEKESVNQRQSIGMTSTYYRWPDGVIPYVIDPALPSPSRITAAVDHWNTRLAGSLTIRPRNGEANYVRFSNSATAGECWSYIGNTHTAGQIIMLGAYCGTGAVIHEIGHAVGLFHEQTREDRDTYIRVNYANITAGMSSNFDKQPTISDDIGAYDYGSIMHYSAYAFSANNQPTIETIPAGIAIGQQNALSPGDIAGARRLYPAVRAVTALEAVFPFTVGSPGGASPVQRVYFQVYTSPTVPANTCHGFYDRPTNAFYLYNDALTTLAGPNGTLQNSQCRVNASPVSAAGNTLTFTLRLTLLDTYAASAKTLYIWPTGATAWLPAGAWDPVAKPPSLAASAPTASTIATQTFTLTARDPNGVGDLQRLYFLVAANTTIPTGGCHGFYDQSVRGLFLYNDALSALSGPLTPGAAGSIQNSQCRLNGLTSSLSTTGTDIVLTVSITRQGAYASGAKSLYLWVTDTAGPGTGWIQAAQWTLASANAPPTLAAAIPATTTAATQTFTLTARDSDGANNLQRIYFLLNTNTNIPTASCHGLYDRVANSIYLYNDSLTAVSAFPLGTNASIQNAQCRINGAATTVSTSGTDIVLNLSLTRQGPYATGVKILYTWITDNDNNGSGWQQASTSSLAGAANQPPTLAAASTQGTTFVLTARDADGAADIQRLYFLINSNTSIPTSSCHGVYDRPTNAIYLYNDSLTAVSAFLLGTTASIQNSQCRIDSGGTSATLSGTELTLRLNLTRRGAYATGPRALYVWLTDSANHDSGWLPAASWTQ